MTLHLPLKPRHVASVPRDLRKKNATALADPMVVAMRPLKWVESTDPAHEVFAPAVPTKGVGAVPRYTVVGPKEGL